MIEIPITEIMKCKANKIGDRIVAKTPQKPHTGLKVDHRHHCGALGEQVFLEYVRGKEGVYKVRTDGKGDTGDFMFFTFENSVIKLDVKTACKEFHSKIMLPKIQLKQHIYAYYIGVKLNGDIGEIWGYCKANELTRNESGFDENNVDTMYRELSELKDLEPLLKQFKDGTMVEQYDFEIGC